VQICLSVLSALKKWLTKLKIYDKNQHAKTSITLQKYNSEIICNNADMTSHFDIFLDDEL
jgi:hypothetical protein